MSKQTKVIIGVASFGVLAIIIGVVLYIFWPAIVGTINDNAYYTAEDLQQAYDKGFDDANFEKEELLNQIDGYTVIISEYELTIKQMTESMDSLESQLQNSNNNYQTALQTIEEYKTQVTSLQSSITTLEEQLESLQTLNSNYSYKISQLESSIVTLNQTIATLNDQITYYEELIESYNFDNKSIITFKVNNKTHDVVVVENGQPFDFEVEDPALLGYSFNGWSKDGITPITLQGYEFTEDTTLTPLMTEENQVYNVRFSASSKYIVDQTRGYSVGHGGIASINIIGANVNSIRMYGVSSTVPGPSNNISGYNEIFEKYGLTELKNYASIEDSKLTIEIPTSVISAIDSDRYFTSDTYSKFQFEIINNTLTLSDFFRSYSSTQDVSKYVYDESKINYSVLFNAETNLNKQYTIEFESSASSDCGSATGKLTFINGVGSFEWTSFSDDCFYSYSDDCYILLEKMPVGVYSIYLYLKNDITNRDALVHASLFYFDSETLDYISLSFNGRETGSSFLIKSVTEMA